MGFTALLFNLILAFFIRRNAKNFGVFSSSRFNSFGFFFSILIFTQSFVQVSFLPFPQVARGVTAQAVYVNNGSLVWAIPGATLAFSATPGCHDRFSSDISGTVTLKDLNTAINQSFAIMEPQVNYYYIF